MAMDVHGRASSSVAVVVAAAVLITVGPVASSADSTRAASVKSASGQKLVQFFRPTGDTLVQKGTGPIRVVVQLRAGARLTKVDVDGVVVTGLLRPEPGGYYGGVLSFGRHLHYGVNDAFAQATGRNGSRAIAHVRFIVAKRDDSLLRLTSFSTQTAAAPLQVGVRETTGTHVRAALSAAQGVSARVYVNDRRVDRGFSLQGGRLMVALGAGEGLRFGRNLVQILVHKTHPYKRQSSYDIESRTVYIPRNAPIASAGDDHTITGDRFVRFDGRATKLPPGWTNPSFRWRIVSAPKGSKAKLRNASASRPTVVPDRAGVYDVRVSVRGTPPRVSSGLGARDAAATGASNDTATLTEQPDITPVGLPLDTVSGSDRGILLGGQPVPGIQSSDTSINYAVLDRTTLQITNSGSVSGDVGGIQQLGTIVDQYSGSLGYLVVLNWDTFGTDIDAERPAFDALLQKIGASASDAGTASQSAQRYKLSPGSAVGVPGAAGGSAFVTVTPYEQAGRLSGYLRLNGAIGPPGSSGLYDFVFTDAVDFDTETNQTRTDISPAQLTIKVGEKTYTEPNPGGGVSGFHLLVLDTNTLGDPYQQVYTTNAADGTEEKTGEVQRLASLLNFLDTDRLGYLVILQGFGAPNGNDGPWDDVAKGIERLGGTRQVFDAMNASDPRALNGEDAKRRGPYAFVGRAGSTAPLAEASYSLNGEPGRLRGVLMRARNGRFEPMIAGPPRSDGQAPVNTELIHIANQAPQAFPAFQDDQGRPIDAASAQAVQNFLGGQRVTGLCSAAVTVCDIRKTYYQNYGAAWTLYANKLEDQKCPDGPGFTAAQCNGIRTQLADEVFDVAKVTHYFGRDGLQAPFGAVGVSALANLTAISQEIKDAVIPAAANNTPANVLTGLSILANVGYATPVTTPIAAGLYAAFALGAYFTRDNGSADLIGPKITTAASKLGVELADRFQQAGQNLNDLGRLIVSDYGKLTAVASKVDAQPGPGETDWRLGDPGQASNLIERAAKQTIYEALVPLAYPVMYDLGNVGNAREWYCESDALFTASRHLFGEQPDGAQFVGRFPDPGPGYPPWTTNIAVAQANATGSQAAARIPGVPGSITDKLFGPVAQGDLGLNTLEFYSPRNGFRYFPANPGTTPLEPHDQRLPSLIAFPYQSGPDERIGCSDVPDPPGDSG
jgi:hypothetical protein